jgi:MFS family permease
VSTARKETVAESFGLNRTTAAVLVTIGCLGLAEEIWANFLSLHLRDLVAAETASDVVAVTQAALLMGVISSVKNLLEGLGYIAGGSIAHRMGPRAALTVSALPMFAGFILMLVLREPWAIAVGALLMTNWEPLSVPAAFDIVGSSVPKHRRTIAFAMQSIQKRLPKMVGPAIGGLAFGVIGYWLNLTLALGLVGLAVVLQFVLTRRMRPRDAPAAVPFRDVMRGMPRDLRRLLTAEIFIRWGDWFARDFAVLYVVSVLVSTGGWTSSEAAGAAGLLLAIMAATALATYVPVARWVDRSPSPRRFIGATFLLFALFPICLVLLPRLALSMGLPVLAGFVLAFVLNGLREIGEPARKSLITAGFPAPVRARGVGIYWGLRSFAFCPAPLVAALIWRAIGPDATFLLGGVIGLAGTGWYALTELRGDPAHARS